MEDYVATINVLVSAEDKTQAYYKVFKEFFKLTEDAKERTLPASIVKIERNYGLGG